MKKTTQALSVTLALFLTCAGVIAKEPCACKKGGDTRAVSVRCRKPSVQKRKGSCRRGRLRARAGA